MPSALQLPGTALSEPGQWGWPYHNLPKPSFLEGPMMNPSIEFLGNLQIGFRRLRLRWLEGNEALEKNIDAIVLFGIQVLVLGVYDLGWSGKSEGMGWAA